MFLKGVITLSETNKEETKAERLEKVMDILLEAVKGLHPGDNKTIPCPICGQELVVYKPFHKTIAAKCKEDSCIKVVR